LLCGTAEQRILHFVEEMTEQDEFTNCDCDGTGMCSQHITDMLRTSSIPDIPPDADVDLDDLFPDGDDAGQTI
jgi:hypothetical protein